MLAVKKSLKVTYLFLLIFALSCVQKKDDVFKDTVNTQSNCTPAASIQPGQISGNQPQFAVYCDGGIKDVTPPSVMASPNGGVFGEEALVELTLSEPGIIYYTTDGSTPFANSFRYTGKIPLINTTTLKYFAVDMSGNRSQEYEKIFTLDPLNPTITVMYKTRPAISNVLNAAGQFPELSIGFQADRTGIYRVVLGGSGNYEAGTVLNDKYGNPLLDVEITADTLTYFTLAGSSFPSTGDNNLYIYVMSDAGNIGQYNLTMPVDNIAPMSNVNITSNVGAQKIGAAIDVTVSIANEATTGVHSLYYTTTSGLDPADDINPVDTTGCNRFPYVPAAGHRCEVIDSPVTFPIRLGTDILSGTGQRVLRYRALDKAGNLENLKEQIYEFDIRVAEITATGIPAKTNGDFNFTFNSIDELSQWQVATNGGQTWNSGTIASSGVSLPATANANVNISALNLIPNMINTVVIRGIKASNNKEGNVKFEVLLDNLPPVISLNPLPGTISMRDSDTSSIRISIANEEDKNDTQIYFTLDGSPATTASLPYIQSGGVAFDGSVIFASGETFTQTINYLAVDSAGNQSSGSAVYTFQRRSTSPLKLIDASPHSSALGVHLLLPPPGSVSSVQFQNTNGVPLQYKVTLLTSNAQCEANANQGIVLQEGTISNGSLQNLTYSTPSVTTLNSWAQPKICLYGRENITDEWLTTSLEVILDRSKPQVLYEPLSANLNRRVSAAGIVANSVIRFKVNKNANYSVKKINCQPAIPTDGNTIIAEETWATGVAVANDRVTVNLPATLLQNNEVSCFGIYAQDAFGNSSAFNDGAFIGTTLGFGDTNPTNDVDTGWLSRRDDLPQLRITGYTCANDQFTSAITAQTGFENEEVHGCIPNLQRRDLAGNWVNIAVGELSNETDSHGYCLEGVGCTDIDLLDRSLPMVKFETSATGASDLGGLTDVLQIMAQSRIELGTFDYWAEAQAGLRPRMFTLVVNHLDDPGSDILGFWHDSEWSGLLCGDYVSLHTPIRFFTTTDNNWRPNAHSQSGRGAGLRMNGSDNRHRCKDYEKNKVRRVYYNPINNNIYTFMSVSNYVWDELDDLQIFNQASIAAALGGGNLADAFDNLTIHTFGFRGSRTYYYRNEFGVERGLKVTCNWNQNCSSEQVM